MMSDQELRMYIVVNTDAGMGKGKAAAQVGHAVMNVTEHLLTTNKPLYHKYKRNGMPKIVLKANQNVMNQLEFNYPNAFPIRDSGRTQVAPGTLTAIGFLPMTDTDQNILYPELKSLKLL
jgi:peptidyl-tRNA hydrolase, PTH2 family